MERNSDIDFVKGIAIVLMVFCHATEHVLISAHHFIYLFHMPVFFIVSGLFYRYEKVIDSPLGFLHNKMHKLWFPCVLWTSIFIVLSDLSWKCKVSRLILAPLMVSRMPLGGALWFLQTLLWIYLFHVVSDVFLLRFRCSNRLFLHSIIAFAFMFIGHVWSLPCVYFWGGLALPAGYALFLLGELYNRIEYFVLKTLRGSRYMNLIVIICSILCLCILMRFENVSLSTGKYYHMVTLIVGACVGFLLLLNLSWLSSFYSYPYSAIAFIGRNTMPILIFHLIAFRLVNCIIVSIHVLPRYHMTDYPVITTAPLFWLPVYVFIGIAFPIVISVLYRKAKDVVFSGSARIK